MAAPVVASYATGTASSGSSMSLAAPSGVADGDYLVMGSLGVKFNSAPTIASFTSLSVLGSTGTSGSQARISERIADSEPSSYTVTLSGASTGNAVILMRVTGATSSPRDGAVVTISAFNETETLTKTTSGDDELAIVVAAEKDTNSNLSTPSGWTDVAAADSGAGFDTAHVAAFAQTVASPGTINASFTSTSRFVYGFLVALKSPPPPVEIAATASGAASTAALLSVPAPLAGVSGGAASTAISIVTIGPEFLDVAAAGAADVAGSLISPVRLSGASAGVASLVSRLISPVRLPVESDGVAAASGALSAHFLLGTLAADGVAGASGVLYAHSLLGVLSSDGQAGATGVLIAPIDLALAASGAASPSAVLISPILLAGASAGVAGTSFDFSAGGFHVVAAGSSSAEAEMHVARLLAMGAGGASATMGRLIAGAPLSVSSDGVASAGVASLFARSLLGTLGADGVGAASAALAAAMRIALESDGVASTSAVLRGGTFHIRADGEADALLGFTTVPLLSFEMHGVAGTTLEIVLVRFDRGRVPPPGFGMAQRRPPAGLGMRSVR